MGLCNVCVGMLRGGRGDVWTGTHDLTFEHHKNTASLRRSRAADCTICIVLAGLCREDGIDMLEDQALAVRATLHKRSNQDGFRLDFDIEKRHSRTFLLKPISALSKNSHVNAYADKIDLDPDTTYLRTPKSANTSSDEVFERAHGWIDHCNTTCNCSHKTEPNW